MRSLALKSLVVLLIASSVQGQSSYEASIDAVVVKIGGASAQGQVVTAGDDLEITCRVVASAKAWWSSAPSGTKELEYRARYENSLRVKVGGSTVAGPVSYSGEEEDEESAEVSVPSDETLTITYTVQVPPTPEYAHQIVAISNVSTYYNDGGWNQVGIVEGGSATRTVKLNFVRVEGSDPVQFEVIAEDMTPPVITCPADITVVPDPGNTGAVVDYVVTATDGPDGSGVATLDCSPASGSLFPAGTTTVTCTATDGVGNEATRQFTVTVEEQDVVGFFEAAVADGTLVGRGDVPAVAEFRLDLMRALLEIADALILDGRVNFARFLLELAYDFTDGQPQPMDLVEGDSASGLAAAIQALIDSL